MEGKGTPVAIVTGGTRGLGRAIAERLLADGWEVAVCGRRPPEMPVMAAGREALALAADIRDPEAVMKLVADVVARFGRLDLLVNNAGGAPKVDLVTSSPSLREDRDA